jgi:hypothetical protein
VALLLAARQPSILRASNRKRARPFVEREQDLAIVAFAIDDERWNHLAHAQTLDRCFCGPHEEGSLLVLEGAARIPLGSRRSVPRQGDDVPRIAGR